MFEDVVGDEGDRQFEQYLRGENLAAEPLLQRRERLDVGKLIVVERWGLRGLRLDHEQFAVEHLAVGNPALQRRHFRKALAHEFLAAGPQPPMTRALDILRADAVELPFHEPVLDRPQQRRHFVERRLERMREKEGIGMAARRPLPRLVVRGDQRGEVLRLERAAGLGIAHHALRHTLGVDA